MTKLLCFSTQDLSIRGGSFKAAYRLHKSFIENGITSRMIVQNKYTDDNSIILSGNRKINKLFSLIAPTIDTLPKNLYRRSVDTDWSTGWFKSFWLGKSALSSMADIYLLFWINDGFMSLRDIGKILNLGKPVFWRLSDMWPFTGGCHYSYACIRYHEGCGKCPILRSNYNLDLSKWVIMRKRKMWNTRNLTLVAPSKWIMDCVSKSFLFKDVKVVYIPTGVNTNVYRPIEKKVARNILNLTQDKILILSGAVNLNTDSRKGGHYLNEVLKKLNMEYTNKKLALLTFGSSQLLQRYSNIDSKSFGLIYDDTTLALLYSASDIFLAPYMADNLPNTVLEALACGTPCVAFDVGGIPDVIEHKRNGYLAKPFVINDYVYGVNWIIKNIINQDEADGVNEGYKILSENATVTISEKFSLKNQTDLYLKLFQKGF